MTLDEYRLKLLERLRGCRNASAACGILAEADLVLANSHLKRITQERFWEAVEDDLEAIAEEVKLTTNPRNAAALEAVIVVARARIARYRERSVGDADASGC